MRRTAFFLGLTWACQGVGDAGGDPDDTDGNVDTDTNTNVGDTDIGDTDDPTTPLDVCVTTLIETYVQGVLSSRTTHVYGGALRVESTFESGYHADTGEFLYTSLVTYTYDANDLLVLSEADGPFGIDGILDSETRYTYNAAGQLTLEEYEFYADATRNSSHAYTYDGAGNLVLEELDAGDDGILEDNKSYTYNDAGDVATVEEIAGDVSYLWAYTYDAAGQLIEITIDTGENGSVDSSTTYTYDAAGNQLTEAIETNGQVQQQSTWTYDASGHKLTWLWEFPSSGFLQPQLYTYTYDGEGNLALVEYDEAVDGDVDGTTEYTYDCPDA